MAEYKASGLPYTSVVQDGQKFISIHHGADGVLTLPDTAGPVAQPSGPSATPFVSGGLRFRGFYIQFTQAEQRAIRAAGTVLVVGGLCSIPFVGAAVCRVISAVSAAIVAFIIRSGFCPGQQQLRVNVTTFFKVYVDSYECR